MIKISVIMPVYKTEKYLPASIESVIRQPLNSLELILVDDGSPDGCGEICDTYAKKDSRIRVIHKKNAGVSSARNDALAQAIGEYVMFLDSDDLLVEGVFDDNLLGLLSGVDIVFGGYYISDENCNIISTHIYDNTMPRDKLTMVSKLSRHHFSSILYKRELLNRNSLRFNPEYFIGEDVLFKTEAILHAQSCEIISKPLFIYRRNYSSVTNSAVSAKAAECFAKQICERVRIIEYTSQIPDYDSITEYFRYITVGMLLEYLILCGKANMNREQTERLLRQNNLLDLFDNSTEYCFSDSIRRQLSQYSKNPKLFLRKNHLKYKISRIIKRFTPQRLKMRLIKQK